MKTKQFLTITALVLMIVMMAVPSPVQATSPEDDLAISANMTLGLDGTSAEGTFTISSSLFPTDSGTAYETFQINLDDMTIHGVKTLTGANGTIVLKFQASITQEGVIGRFVIISGTGAYEKLHGVGDTFAVMDYGNMPPTLFASYTGQAHID